MTRALRVLVGAGSFADAETALRIARHLVARGAGSLGGLLVEEEALAALCSLPHQRVISMTGAILAAPTPARMRAIINADARAFRQMLEDLSAPSGSGSSFEVETGDLVVTTIASAQGWDVLVLGHSEVHRRAGRVIHLTGPDGNKEGPGEMAEGLARVLNTGLDIYRVSPDHTDTRMTSSGRSFRFDTLETALAGLARTNTQAVVTDLASGPVRSPAELRRLLEAARCPVVVLGAAKSQAIQQNPG